MMPERNFPPSYERKFKEERTLQEDIVRFGDKLWRGPALEIVNPSTIKPEEMSLLEFKLEARHLPFNGDVCPDLLLDLSAHVRSRYAHLGIDVMDVGQRIFENIYERGFPKPDSPLHFGLNVFNHGKRSIILVDKAKLFHLFYTPEGACIRGEELENMIGNREDKPVYIRGEEGKDWSISKESTPEGKEEARGVYLKIKESEKYWIPPANTPIRMLEEGNFRQIRDMLFRHYFKKTDDHYYPMPKDALWIGKGPYVRLSHDIYLMLEHDAYVFTNGRYEKVGMQTHSPLLEGGRTDNDLHLEVKGDADLVRAKVIRNGELAEQG